MAKSKVTLAVNGVGEFEGKGKPGAHGVGHALASAIADWAEGQPAFKGTFTEILTAVLSEFTADIEAKMSSSFKASRIKKRRVVARKAGKTHL